MSQASEIQMLELKLAALDPGADALVRIDLLNELAWELSDTDSKRALSLSQRACELANDPPVGQAPYQTGIAYSLRTQGYVHARLGDNALGLSQLLQAQDLFEVLGYGDGLADVLDGIAGIYYHLNHFPEFLNYMHRQLEVAQRIDDKCRIANANNNLGAIYNSTGDTNRAIEMLLQNLQLATAPGYERIESLALLNLAETYLQTDNTERALDVIERGLAVVQNAGFDIFEIFAHSIAGRIYLRLDRVEEALRALHSAHTLSRTVGSKYNEAQSLLYLGQAHAELGQADLALEYLQACVAIAATINAAWELQDAHRQAAQIYERQGDLGNALEHLKAYHAMKERAFDEKADQRLKVLQVVHDTETAKKEALIAQLRTQQLENEIWERKQTESALQAVQARLEQEVDLRTAELRETVALLQKEIEVRERAELEIQEIVATLEQRVAARTDELATFFDLTLLAGQEETLESVFEQALPRIMEVTRSRAICIHLFDEERKGLRIAGELNFPQGVAPPQHIAQWDVDFDRWLRLPNDPLVTMRLAETTLIPEELRFHTYQTCLGAQIKIGSRVEGLLSCYRFTSRGFGVDEIALVTAVAEQLGMILETKRLRIQAGEIAVLEERQRLARDLHDSVSQTLYSLSLFSRAAREAAEDGDTIRLNHSLRELERNTLHALREMRLLLYELRPADLEQEGLARAITLRMNSVERRVGLELDVRWPELPPMPPKYEAELYHIIVEVLNNVVKHASAHRLSVHLEQAAGVLHLCIADDGRGFEVAAVKAKGGLGLRNVEERVLRLRGQLSITSGPGAGTQIEANIPFPMEVRR
ncbi:MAG: tetratricopeptide repeat protein [Anaerolineales bacterium]|nr:tetratricopeptide repeat protein [Anaerolineales bacterium]